MGRHTRGVHKYMGLRLAVFSQPFRSKFDVFLTIRASAKPSPSSRRAVAKQSQSSRRAVHRWNPPGPLEGLKVKDYLIAARIPPGLESKIRSQGWMGEGWEAKWCMGSSASLSWVGGCGEGLGFRVLVIKGVHQIARDFREHFCLSRV